MTIDERIEALTMNLELVSRQQEADRERIQDLIVSHKDLHADIEELIPLVKDLVRVAEMHEHRITRLEGQKPDGA